MINKKFALFSPDAVVSDDLELKGPVRLGAVNIGAKCVIGKYTYMGANCKVGGGTKLGNYCSIASDVNIGPVCPSTSFLSTHPFQYSEKLFANVGHYKNVNRVKRPSQKPAVVIGNDVSIGTSSIILRGVTIGSGAIIGCGAVVTTDVPPFAIVEGAPAQVIGYRFEESVIDKLLKLKWWTLNPIDMSGVNFNQIDVAIEQIKTIKANITQLKLERASA
jgi:acetyltransferase-like isoleucine patch superfamily enzyme